MLIKKLHLVSWRGCPTFGVQFKTFQTAFSNNGCFVYMAKQLDDYASEITVTVPWLIGAGIRQSL
ncbi:hypothetical protein CYK00_12210 [Neisseria sicca]|uniref:Uncharacterized protein n=1 Tax=Neisseria sicca TaxID=490 RepID=A0A2I1X943_NEISI|nr:hypothetical protein CYK00_12210 [Neisseria sicca]